MIAEVIEKAFRFVLSQSRIMRTRPLVVAALALAVLTGVSWSASGYGLGSGLNRGIGNPIGPGTVPPSGYERGLATGPTLGDTGETLGNLMITGNVRAGKHFRGLVPYRSTSDFGADLGSTSLDSFLRSSAGSENFGSYATGYRPFYSPTATVTSTALGQSAILTPASPRIRDDATPPATGLWGQLPTQWQADAASDQFALQDVARGQRLPSSTTSFSLDALGARLTQLRDERRLYRASSREVTPLPGLVEQSDERLSLESELAIQEPAEGLTAQQYRDQMEQLQQQLKRLTDEANQLKQALAKEQSEEGPRRAGIQFEGLAAEPSEAGVETQLDALERLTRPLSPAEARAKLYQLLRSTSSQESQPERPADLSQDTALEETLAETGIQMGSSAETGLQSRIPGVGTTDDTQQTTEPKTTSVSEWLETRPVGTLSRLGRDLSAVTRAASDQRSLSQGTPLRGNPASSRTATESADSDLSMLEQVNRLSAGELASEARRILGPHADYTSFAKAKFSQYMTAGNEYLKQGKYYRAVDAYTLALLYKSGDSEAYAGKSLALFAAGEYMSSALFVARALQALGPEVGSQKSEFTISIFGPLSADVLGGNGRIADAEECLQICREQEHRVRLQFLLGYIYLRTGRLGDARKVIDEAYQKVPDLPGVIALKRAVDGALAGSN